MRSRFLLTLLMGSCLTAARAADPAPAPEWPKKGETIYLSATIKVSGSVFTMFGFAPVSTEVPACVPLRVAKAKPDREQWFVDDPAKIRYRLHGPWVSRMHETMAACEQTLSGSGEPKVIRDGWVLTIVLPETRAAETPPGSPPVP